MVNFEAAAVALSRTYLNPQTPHIQAAMSKMAQIDGGAFPMASVVDEAMRTHALGSVFVIQSQRTMIAMSIAIPYEQQIIMAMTTPSVFFEQAPQQYKSTMRATLMAIISQNARAYFAANRGASDSDIAAACADYVMQKHKTLSPAEINHAFAWAVSRENFNSYGALSVAFLQSILSQYQRARNSFLSAYEEAINKPTPESIERKAQHLYEQALAEFAALQEDNTRYRFFHNCPHHYVTRFIENGVIRVTQSKKKELYRLSLQYAAYYMLNNAEKQKRPAIKGVVFSKGIEPLIVPNLDLTDKNGNTMLRLIFDSRSAETIADELKETATIFYSKLLYWESIMPYTVS